MAEPVAYIASITERYRKLGYEPYRWYRREAPPEWTPLRKPVAQSRLGVLSTAGGYVRGQVAYHYKDDTSVRAIPKSTPRAEMRFAHLTENYLPGPRRDPNCMVPLEPLQRLEADGVIGEVADPLLTCMGGIYSQRRVREELIPTVAKHFAAAKIDLAFLIPM
jgi:D-proline reductase (dithiol) PrdB